MQLRHLRRYDDKEEQATPDPWKKKNESVSRSANDLFFPPQDSSSSTEGFLLFDFVHHPCLFLGCDYAADEYNVSMSPFESGAAPAAAGSSYYAGKDSSQFDVWELASLGTVAGLISLVTIIGNLIVILSFILERSIRQTSNYFIASLAVSDLLIGCISMPLYTVYLLSDQTWLLGMTLCDLWLSLDYTLCLCSIYTVFCITIDRYCSVTLPAKYRKWRTERKVLVIVAITWVVPVLVFFPSIMGWQYFVEGGRTVPFDKCYVQYMENALFNCLLQVGYFWATLVVMCALYAGIYRVALRLHRKAESRRRRMVSLVSVAGETITRIGIGMTGSAAAARRGISIQMLPLGAGGSGATVVSNRAGTTTTILGRKRLDSNGLGDEDDYDEDEMRSSSQRLGSESGPETPKGLENCWKRPGDCRVPEASDVVRPSRRKSLTTMTRSGLGTARSSPSFLGGRVFTERAENQYMLLPTEDVFEELGQRGTEQHVENEVARCNTVGTSRNGNPVGGGADETTGLGGKRVIICEIRTETDEVAESAATITANATDGSGCSRYFARRDCGCKSLGRGMERSAVNHSYLAVDTEAGKSAPDTKDKQLISNSCSNSNSVDATTTTTGPGSQRLLMQGISRPDQRRRNGFEQTSTSRSNLSFGRRRTHEDVQQVAVTANDGKEDRMEEETGREEEWMTDGRSSGCYLSAHHQSGRQYLSSGLPLSGGDSLEKRVDCDDSDVDCSRLSNGDCGGRVNESTKDVIQGRESTGGRCLPVAEEFQDREKNSKYRVKDDLSENATTTNRQDIGSARSVLNNVSSLGGASEPTAVAAASEITRRQMVVSSRNHVNPSDAWKGTPPATNCTTRCLPLAQGRDQGTPQRVSKTSCPPGRGRWRFSVLRQWSSRKHRSRFFSDTSASSASQKTKHENHARKSVRTITLILGAFVVCWTPWHVLSLIMGFCPSSPESCVPGLLYDISYWLCYLNSPLNPFCYAFANQQFKKTFVRILKLDWRRN